LVVRSGQGDVSFHQRFAASVRPDDTSIAESNPAVIDVRIMSLSHDRNRRVASAGRH
jgi:hypothetical protein